MIKTVREIPITKESYPFPSAEKYCDISELGYEEKEFFFDGTANVYQHEKDESIGIRAAAVPYTNRMIIRQPKDHSKFNGNVIVEIINPTSFNEIDRIWIQGYREMIREGIIYVGITSKPNTVARMVAMYPERYAEIKWTNPTEQEGFPFTADEVRRSGGLADQDLRYETGLWYDMFMEAPDLLRSDRSDNPLTGMKIEKIILSGWSQSANYTIAFLDKFAYRDKSKDIYDGYLVAAPVRKMITPLNQYETLYPYSTEEVNFEYARNPVLWFQTESENGNFGMQLLSRMQGDDPDFQVRQYDIAGTSHDTVSTYTQYYRNDPDLIRIGALPEYLGKDAVPLDYPLHFVVNGMIRNLIHWIRTGVAPARCSLIEMDAHGNNKKDAVGNTIGGIRTCLVDLPTRSYYAYSHINKGDQILFPEMEVEPLFGHEVPFSREMLVQMYQTLDHYREQCIKNTKEQISKGFIVQEDLESIVEYAVRLAREGGLS